MAEIHTLPTNIARITIWERKAGQHRLQSDPMQYQADIVLPGAGDHHAVGRTPAEALLQAAMHWYKHE